MATWKVNCTMCHGGVNDQTGAPPKTTWGHSADAVRAGAHDTHVKANIDCAICHVKPADALSPGHVDGDTATVTFSGVATAGGAAPAWNRDTATCASTYCHGATMGGGTNVSPRWTEVGSGQAACGTCHGLPPPPPHVNSAITGCVNCHSGSVDAQGQVLAAPAGGHLNGRPDSTGHDPRWSDPTSTFFHAPAANADLRECAVCHGANLEGQGTAMACGQCHDQGLPPGVASWKENCVMCHGGTDNVSGAPPKTTWGNGADALRVGAHTKHASK
ncbi:MAG TPA: CxxxxCH/CxxCH domain-containing protein, partial [Vicinamibacteria bacterium]|nr:CxxxxCH/CxxCH domain-containing protein [Vicinamibacteria bacterium]